MFIIRLVMNALIIAGEIALVCAVAWLGYHDPFLFAAVTASLAFVLGAYLETARLTHELPFYFDQPSAVRRLMVPFVGTIEATLKAVLAGIAALFTFAGTNNDRTFWVAILFAIIVYLGASILRTLSLSFDARPIRWGFFRLGPPLGLLFSAGIALAGLYGLITTSNVGDIGWRLVWELPEKPSISQVSELFFQLKGAFDDFIVRIATEFFSEAGARILGIIISVNVLAGFVASLYAAAIATLVRKAEDLLP